jgi:hypothetical protein
LEPLQFHLEASDLLEQFGLLCFGLGGVVGLDAVGEDLLGGTQQVFFPVLDERRMDAKLPGQFVDGLVSLECSECYLSLERRRLLLPFRCHDYPFLGPPQ